MNFPNGTDIGLKDSNGKPILVGDIFKFDRRSDSQKLAWIEGVFSFGFENLRTGYVKSIGLHCGDSKKTLTDLMFNSIKYKPNLT